MAKSSSSKQPQIGGHIAIVHHRLYHALSLGQRSYKDGRKRLEFVDVGIQRLVIRSIDSYLDCISAETLKYPIVKASVPDIIGALEGILHARNEATLSLASNIVVKMINIFPISVLQPCLLDLIRPLASLLPSLQLQVSVSCATALNSIILNLSSKKEEEVWEVLKETNTVAQISKYIQEFSAENKPMEYFEVLTSLLSKILWRWPSSRFFVWSNARLMGVLGTIILTPDFSDKVAVLQLYTALGLCGIGAQKLLERKETLMYIMKHCMTNSNSVSIQIEGFKLAQCLALNQHNFSKMVEICCEPIVFAIINAMSNWTSHSGKVPKDQMPLLMEACRLSLITRWSGKHQKYFWKLGIEKVLLNLLLNNHQPQQSQNSFSIEEQLALAQRGLEAKFLFDLRPYIWDIIGGLAAHCPEDFKTKSELSVNLLITCVCLEFVDSVRNSHQLFQCGSSELYQNESVCRSVLMMVYSPSRYISDQAKYILSEILNPSDEGFPNYVLNKLNKPIHKFGMEETLQTVINLLSLACFFALPQYQDNINNAQEKKTLVSFLKWCLGHDIQMNRSTLAPHLHNRFSNRTCCLVHTEDWDGEYSPLLYCLWNINKLLMHNSGLVEYIDAQLVSELERICLEISAPGPRWYAATILSYIGFYGFPDKFGKKIEEVLNANEFSDVTLLVTNVEPLNVHSVILMVRCPSLLHPKAHPLKDGLSNTSFTEDKVDRERSKKEVRLSANVDHHALSKLLEFVYYGNLKAEAELIKKLKILARHCNLQYLLQLLCHKIPRWGTPFPSFDFTYALGPAGYSSSDIILEGKSEDQMQWRCSNCTLSAPHLHVHKVILFFTSWYFRALFGSGMQESHSGTIKVPVSLKALEKLVNWFYSGELSKPLFGCLWDNLDEENKLSEIYPYLELCWLTELWCLDDFHEECQKVVISFLESTKRLYIKTIQIAANLSQWGLVEAAAYYIAPIYQHLRTTNELDDLDEELIEMVRSASVRFSQEGSKQ